MTNRILTTSLFFFIPFLLFAQKKTLVKLEFPIGIMPEKILFIAQPVSIMFPTIYVPIHKHLDIGAGYANPKYNYYVEERDPVDLTYKYYRGNIKYKVTSLYFKINLSASQKRVNPFFAYVLSFSKGTYTGPIIDSTSKFNDYYGNTYNGNVYGQNDDFSYSERMTSQEEGVLKKALDKSQISHGVQVGLDYKIMPFLNLFVKASSFSVMGYASRYKKEQAFPIWYKETEKQYAVSPMQYYMFGVILKIDGGKKSLIK